MPVGTLAEKKRLQTKSNILVLIAIAGLVVFVGIGVNLEPNSPLVMPLVILRLLLIIPWLWGLSEYSKSKGYSGVWCLLGLIGCIGLLILVVMPDKYVVATEGETGPSNYYRPPPAT